MDIEPLRPGRPQIFEGEAGEIARAGADAAEGMLRDAFHREGGNELSVLVLQAVQAHVLDLGVVGAGHDLQKVVVFRKAGHGVPGVLQRPQLHLRLQLPVIAGYSRFMTSPRASSSSLGVTKAPMSLVYISRHRHVVLRAAGGDGGDLRVHSRVREDEAAAGQEHLVKALDQGAVQGHLGGEHSHVLDVVAAGARASGPQGL